MAPSKKKEVASSGAKKGRQMMNRVRDPNKPKRPPTAFLLFMEGFRKSYKEAHPESKGIAQVFKKGGERWKVISEEEKKAYVERAAELKSDYDHILHWRRKG